MLMQSAPAVRTYTVLPYLLFCIAVLIAFFAFGSGLLELVTRWSTQEEYSHGFLIPAVAAWMLWSRRDAVVASLGKPSWTGFAAVVLAALMLILSELSAFFLLSQVGFVVALLGIVLSLGGISLLRVIFVPIAFLVFAIPLPYFLDAELSSRLQLISSQLGVYFIRFFGVPVYLTGNVIDLGTYKLQVAEACSGLRYLYPLLSLGFLAAYLFQAPLWQRALVFLSAVPITIAMNSFRIGITGLMVDRWGIEQAQGVLHFFEGWVIFIASAAIMAAEIFVLARFGSGKRFSQIFHNPKVFPAVAQDPQWKSRSPGTGPLLACLMVLCAVGVASFNINERHEIVPDRLRFISFPTTLGDWLGHPSLMETEIERTLGVDDYILSDYVNPRNDVVNFYIAYYASQRKGSSPHSPEVCIPGGGWQITKFERTNYKSQSLGINLPLNRVIIAQDNDKQLVYYWFVQRGRNIANEYWSKWYLLVDAITKGRTDGALVRLVTPLRANEPEQAADERLQAFIDQLEPRLKSYLPPETAPDIKAVVHDAKDQQS